MDIESSLSPPSVAVYPQTLHSSIDLPPTLRPRTYEETNKSNKPIMDIDNAIFKVLSLYIGQATDSVIDTSLLPLPVLAPFAHKQHRYSHNKYNKHLQRSGTATNKSNSPITLLRTRRTNKSWLGDQLYNTGIDDNKGMKNMNDLILERNTFKNSLTVMENDDKMTTTATMALRSKKKSKKKTVSFNETSLRVEQRIAGISVSSKNLMLNTSMYFVRNIDNYVDDGFIRPLTLPFVVLLGTAPEAIFGHPFGQLTLIQVSIAVQEFQWF
ncbi:hypothetical protein BDF20DRAFT_832135 [Mycotypha africana]|uniref:uncharacterized protein n=1 Tax=Mycotypha africana TaxID=64632 RepID=UPI002300934A|nr:uncharacterized protein BDF20DRAFT_832135 [Mycotypha africana]KAI8992156.1 hypothetical protein BDF20DRAFT_832135 [Mycotypha africana]